MNTAPPSGFAAGLVLTNRYRLDAATAPGSMAEVWNGEDLVLKRPVAIKLLHPYLAKDPELVERFRREAIGAARLAHPNIVPTYDAGTDDGTAYIILGLVHSPNLGTALENGNLPIETAVSIAKQITDAVAVAHAAGIVHRDLNPNNVFVAGEDHRVLVTDFGLATAVAETSDETLNVSGVQIGSAEYHAPEQKSGEGADARSDVYAIGTLLRNMLGYAAGDAASVIDKATAENPDDRYQDAAEFSDALGALAEKIFESTPKPKRPAHRLPAPKAPRQNRPAPAAPVDEEEVTAPHQHLNTGEYRFTQDAQPVPTPQPFDPRTNPISERDHSSNGLIKVLSVTVVLLLLVAAVGLGILINQAGSGDGEAEQTTTATTAAPLALAQAATFDPPPGDLSENDATVGNVIDGDPATSWATSTYQSSTFGSLKTGVGLVVRTNTEAELKTLTVDSNGQGWNAQIYVADSIPTTLGGWGDMIDNQSGLGNSATFDLHNATGSTVLIWITNLGSGNRLSINEVEVGA